MDQLSLELLMLIASHLHHYDLPAFRLVSRSFACAGVEHLNIKKNFFFRKHSLRRLYSVARHPVLRRSLTEIVFFVDVVPAYQSQEAWESQARATCHTSQSGGRDRLAKRWLQKYKLYEIVALQKLHDDDNDNDKSNNDFRTSGWHIQQKIRQEQEDLLDHSSTTFDELHKYLAMLPRLRSFSLDTFEQYHREIMRPLFVLDNDQEWYCCNYTCALESFRQVTERLVHAALTRTRANQPSRTHLQTLGTYITAFIDTNKPTCDVSPWREDLRHLQTLNLSSVLPDRLDICLPSHENVGNPDSLYRHVTVDDIQQKTESFLQQVILNVGGLRSLSIALPPVWHLNTHTIFLGAELPCLNSLELSSIDIAVSSFRTFLSSHTDSLKALHLFNATLSTDTDLHHNWIEFFKFMARNLHLSDAHFDGLLNEHHLDIVTFDQHATHSLASGLTITMQGLARFLVCGQFPPSMDDPRHPDREEFTRLDWSILTAGYS